MTWIKICGTTNLEDALMCAEAGADALGLVFAESPRKIDAATASRITASLPASIEKVGVFVDESIDRVVEISESARLDAIQLHGDEFGDYVSQLRKKTARRIIQTVTKQSPKRSAWQRLASIFVRRISEPLGGSNEIYAWLYDSSEQGLRGGTGIKWDWSAWAGCHTGARNIVAGGLTPENVGEAIRILKPWGVDVVTGVERAPGKKDPAKVKAFIQAVRAADRNP